jgi:hypothetical protein
MKKGEFIESILLRISGGELNDELPVQREDIEFYLPAAVNYALTAEYNTNLAETGTREFTSLFYGYFYSLPLLEDSNRNNRKYFVLPKAVVPLRQNQGIRAVYDGCEHTYLPIPESSLPVMDHYCKMFPGTKFYRPEGNKVYVWNEPKIAKQIAGVTLLTDAADLGMEDQLPIPAGMEIPALDVCFGLVTGQREGAADLKNNKRPINSI